MSDYNNIFKRINDIFKGAKLKYSTLSAVP